MRRKPRSDPIPSTTTCLRSTRDGLLHSSAFVPLGAPQPGLGMQSNDEEVTIICGLRTTTLPLSAIRYVAMENESQRPTSHLACVFCDTPSSNMPSSGVADQV